MRNESEPSSNSSLLFKSIRWLKASLKRRGKRKKVLDDEKKVQNLISFKLNSFGRWGRI